VSGGGVDYSTTEQDTGLKWIDGKTIYQKTINFGTLPNNNSKAVAHGISNLDYVVDYNGVFKNPNDTSNTFIKINHTSISSASYQAESYINLTSIILWCATNRSGYSGYFTILYTKTS
jgi:hypothetical protein